MRKRLSLDVNHSGIPVVRWKNVFFSDHMDGTAIKSSGAKVKEYTGRVPITRPPKSSSHALDHSAIEAEHLKTAAVFAFQYTTATRNCIQVTACDVVVVQSK